MTWFRPGRFDQPSAVQTQRTWEQAVARGQSVLRSAGEQLASLLREVSRHPNPVEPEESEQDPAGDIPFPVHPAYPAYRSRYLPALTRPAIENLPGKQAAVVVIPVGAIEQHGPHLPVGTDTVLGHAWLQTALTRIPACVPVYVGPTLAIGKSIEHQGFPGTVSITGRLLRHNLLAIARQLKDWGFHTVAVLNTHGGNSASIEVVLREIQTGLDMTAGMLRPSLARSDSVQENTFGIHAGEVETSLMLAIAPDQVRMDLAECEYPARLNDPGGLRPVKGKATFAWTARDISKTGIMGDAKVATPEKGRAWLEQGGQELAEDLVRLSGQIAN
jgi:creatinine amidohydrolase